MKVRINTSALSFPLFHIPGVTADWVDGSTSAELNLQPGEYGFQPGPIADFRFRVTAGGAIDYDDQFVDFLGGKNTNELKVLGYKIRIDGTALDHATVFSLPKRPQDPNWLLFDKVHEITLVPASGYRFHPTSGLTAIFDFGLDRFGKIKLDERFAGFASGAGTDTLKISGYTIHVDGTALSHHLIPLFPGWGGRSLPSDQINELTVMPCEGYTFQPSSGLVSSLRYGVDLMGNVTIGSKYSAFASGAGTTKLTIRGYKVKLDGRRLSHNLFPMLWGWTGGFLPRTKVNELTLIPCNGYGVQPGSGVVADMNYNVGIDGKVSYDATCKTFLEGEGTDTLVLDGYAIVVDASKADSDLVGLTNLGLQAQTPRYLFAVLLPAAHLRPQTRNGVFSHGFGITRDGGIKIDPTVSSSYRVTTIPRIEILGATPV